jgi:hypothetical protein
MRLDIVLATLLVALTGDTDPVEFAGDPFDRGLPLRPVAIGFEGVVADDPPLVRGPVGVYKFLCELGSTSRAARRDSAWRRGESNDTD